MSSYLRSISGLVIILIYIIVDSGETCAYPCMSQRHANRNATTALDEREVHDNLYIHIPCCCMCCCVHVRSNARCLIWFRKLHTHAIKHIVGVTGRQLIGSFTILYATTWRVIYQETLSPVLCNRIQSGRWVCLICLYAICVILLSMNSVYTHIHIIPFTSFPILKNCMYVLFNINRVLIRRYTPATWTNTLITANVDH